MSTESSGLLQTLQNHIEEIRSHLQCGICVRPLYEPYTLACGHTFCYGCLTSWLNSGRSHKTCPDCRATVTVQPAPAYLVRTIVQIFTGRAELLDKGETTTEHEKNQREEAQRLEADKSNTNPRTGGLFQGFFKPKPEHREPIIDPEDGVERCPHCTYELEEDACPNCGYVNELYDSEVSSFTDDFSDISDDFDGMDEDDLDVDNMSNDRPNNNNNNNNNGNSNGNPYNNNGHYGGRPYPNTWEGYAQADIDHMRRIEQYYLPGPHLYLHPIQHHYTSTVYDVPWGLYPPSSMGEQSGEDEDEEEEEDDDEDAEMDSFIDDEDVEESATDRSTVVGDNTYSSQYEFDRSNEFSAFHSAFHDGVTHHDDDASVSGISDDGEHFYMDEESGDGEDSDVEEGVPANSNNSSTNNGDDDDDDDDDEGPIRLATRRQQSQQQQQQQPRPQLPVPLRRPHQTQYPRPPTTSNNRSSNPRRRPHRSSAQRGAPARARVGRQEAGTSANNAINVEDDSEDEMPIPPTRRARLNRR